MQRGFTLIEIIVTLSLSLILTGIAISEGMRSFTQALAQNDRANIYAALLRARAEALNGVCFLSCTTEQSHGVFITDKSIEIFEGNSYQMRTASLDEYIPLSGHTHLSAPAEIVFEAITGSASTPQEIDLTEGSTTMTISITTEGQIRRKF